RAERVHPAVVGRDRGVPRARRRAAVVCDGLLRTRQPLLPGVGRDRAYARELPGVDQAPRARYRGFRSVQARAPRVGAPGGGLMNAPAFTTEEVMTVAAARMLKNGAVCFVGIGLPSTAANLARLTHAPDLVL